MSTVGAWHYGQGALHPNEEIEIDLIYFDYKNLLMSHVRQSCGTRKRPFGVNGKS